MALIELNYVKLVNYGKLASVRLIVGVVKDAFSFIANLDDHDF